MSDQNRYRKFQAIVWQYFAQHGRSMPWREPGADGQFDPYKIMVSEVMLQQTQVSRVIPKVNQFMAVFPDIKTLAQASQGDVLRTWSGLGYNRRAKYLHQAAQATMEKYGGTLPHDMEKLKTLPGIGPNTAAAICVYSFNQPLVFIETNIRTVYLHHFFADQQAVRDRTLEPIIAATLDKTDPRRWYWALMDYGAYLKSVHANPARRSHHHNVQTKFEGSVRQIRGQVIRLLAERPLTASDLQQQIGDNRLPYVLEQLTAEGLIHQAGQY